MVGDVLSLFFTPHLRLTIILAPMKYCQSTPIKFRQCSIKLHSLLSDIYETDNAGQHKKKIINENGLQHCFQYMPHHDRWYTGGLLEKPGGRGKMKMAKLAVVGSGVSLKMRNRDLDA